jgi:hypothetical protein
MSKSTFTKISKVGQIQDGRHSTSNKSIFQQFQEIVNG